MAAEEVKSTLRGLLLADPRFSWENRYTSGTTASQAGPHPDVAVGQGSERARLDVVDLQTGSVVAAERWVQAQKAGGHGYPSPARLTWSTTDGGTERSWMGPAQCLDYFWLAFESGLTTYSKVSLLGLADGSTLVVYLKSVSGTATGVFARILGAENTSYTPSAEVTVYSITAGTSFSSGRLGLCQLPSGRILVCGASAIIAYSDDSGNTWTASEASPTGGVGEFSTIAHHGGYLTMVSQTNASPVSYWYTSTDQGGTWTATGDGLTVGAVALGLPDGGVGMVYIEPTARKLRYATRPSPFAEFDLTNSVVIYDGDTFKASCDTDGDIGHVAACVGQDGLICVVVRLHDPAAVTTPGCRMLVARFRPGIQPATITNYFHPDCIHDSKDQSLDFDGEVLDWGDKDERCYLPSLAPRGAGYLLACTFESNAGTYEGSIGAFVLGGWSSIQYTPATFGRADDATIYGRCYAAVQPPQNVAGWTKTGPGVPTFTTDGAGIADVEDYLFNGDADGGQVFAIATVKATAGAITAEDNFLRVVRTDGATYHYSVTLRLSSTGARLWDDNAGATLGSDVTGLTASTHRQWLVWLSGAYFVAYRDLDSSLWTITHTSSGGANATNDATPPVLVSSVRWGSTTGGGTCYWRWVGAFTSADATVQAALLPAFLAGQRGRPTSTRTQYLSSGLGYRSSGAPFFGGDEWQLPVRYDYGLANLDPCVTPSPTRSWRSTATTEQVYAWDLGADTSLMSPAVGLTVLNPLGRTWYLEGSTNGSAWTTLATLDAAEGMNGLTFARTGDMVYQNAGSSASYACHADELVGGWAVLTSGGGTIYAARILGNTEGAWIGSGKPLHLRIELPTSGSLPTSGTLAILWPAATRVAWAVTTQYRYWRVRVAAITLDATTSPQYLSASKVIIGPFIPFGQDYSWGRVSAMSPQQVVTTGRGGQRSVQRLGNARRAAEIQWTDANYAKSVFANSPNWIAGAASAQPLAFAHDFRQVESLILRQSGARYPVVYLPSVAYASGGTTLVGSERQLYGRILSDTVTRVATSGNEAENEATTIGAFRMEEEL